MIARSVVQQATQLGVRSSAVAASRRNVVVVSRPLHVSSAVLAKQTDSSTLKPTHESRTSPKQGTQQHPGYTRADTPVTDSHFTQMPGADLKAGETPSGQARLASTRADAEHPGVREMAEGGKIGGSDAITPEERNVKNWATNQRTPEFNAAEGKRNPIRDGGSNEGGFDDKGNSKT